MFDYQFKLAAAVNAADNVIGRGNFVRYDRVMTGEVDPEITVKAVGGSGAVFDLKPGQGVVLPEAADYFRVVNKNGTVAITGVLKVGEGTFLDNRIQGEVSVIDGGLSRTLEGTAFLSSGYQPAVIGEYAHVQLLNLSGTHNLVVNRIDGVDTAGALSFYLREHSNVGLTDFAMTPRNKLVGGAVSTRAAVRTQTNPSHLGTGMQFSWQPANEPWPSPMQEPIVIAPNKSILAVSGVTNRPLYVRFDHFEKAVT